MHKLRHASLLIIAEESVFACMCVLHSEGGSRLRGEQVEQQRSGGGLITIADGVIVELRCFAVIVATALPHHSQYDHKLYRSSLSPEK